MAEIFAVEIGDAEFGHYVVDVGPGGGDAGPSFKNGTILSRRVGLRRESDDRLPSVAQAGPADEIHLPADAGVLSHADRVGTDLTGKVDLDRRVYGCHLWIAANDRGVIDVPDVEHQHLRIVVYKVIELTCAHHKTGNDAARVLYLQAAVDHALLDERNNTIREHLRVNAEVLVIAERREHGVRYGTDAHLYRRSVVDDRRDVLADRTVFIGQLRHLHLMQRLVDLDHKVDGIT